MNVTVRMDHLTTSTTYIYGVLSVLASLLAASGNTIVLIVLWQPNQRIKSNKILTSLAISDSLVGYVLLPFASWQYFTKERLLDKTVDFAREYLTCIFIGSSVFTLGVISYDRYILLTKLKNYDVFMNKYKIILLLGIAWVFPIVAPVLRLLGKGPFLYIVILITGGPFIVLILIYFQITKAIMRSDKRIRAQQVQGMNSPNVDSDESLSTFNEKLAAIEKKTAITMQGKVTDYSKLSTSQIMSTVDELKNSGHLSPAVVEKNSSLSPNMRAIKKLTKRRRTKGKHVKLAKTVTLLIICYSVCLLPSVIWSIADLINESFNIISISTIQQMYIFACFAASVNSLINPIIYFFKQPGFKKSLKRLLGMKKTKTLHESDSYSMT